MIVLDYQDRRPIYEQVTEKLQNLILKGILEPNTQLPSVRKLAIDLSINPNTIQRAYNQLEVGGFIYSIKGKGSFVSQDLEALEIQKKLYFQDLEKVVKQGKEKGLKREELLEKVREIYEEV